jgi:Flp pilus assembly pilin Flp
MHRSLTAFCQEEDGAVTVDFVVLTASVVALTIIVMPLIIPSVSELAGFIAEELGAASAFLAEVE